MHVCERCVRCVCVCEGGEEGGGGREGRGGGREGRGGDTKDRTDDDEAGENSGRGAGGRAGGGGGQSIRRHWLKVQVAAQGVAEEEAALVGRTGHRP